MAFKIKQVLNYLFGILILLVIPSCSSQNISYKSEIEQYQNNLKEQWENPDTTPLHEDELADFQGITFFPINEKYRVEAIFTPETNEEIIEFSTSAQKIKMYKNYGLLNFKIKGKPLELTVYQSSPINEDYADHLFIPFTDLTNGVDSYGGGRYLDIYISDIQNGKVVIDFNESYNPYCAYSRYYNCPIPPANNFLDTEIKAGVSYHQSH